MNKPISGAGFWEKWYAADELERLRLVQTLTGFKRDYGQASLLNSYLSDLADYLSQEVCGSKDVVWGEPGDKAG